MASNDKRNAILRNIFGVGVPKILNLLQNNYSQRQLAAFCNTSQSDISRAVTGIASVAVYLNICQTLNIHYTIKITNNKIKITIDTPEEYLDRLLLGKVTVRLLWVSGPIVLVPSCTSEQLLGPLSEQCVKLLPHLTTKVTKTGIGNALGTTGQSVSRLYTGTGTLENYLLLCAYLGLSVIIAGTASGIVVTSESNTTYRKRLREKDVVFKL